MLHSSLGLPGVPSTRSQYNLPDVTAVSDDSVQQRFRDQLCLHHQVSHVVSQP